MNSCLIEITFKFVGVNNSFMDVEAEYSNSTVLVNNCNGTGVYSQQVLLPACLKFKFSGKNEDSDTIIDSSGNIIIDKHILIESILLDRIPVNHLFLIKNLSLQTPSGKKVNSNYIGFNGELELLLEKNNTFNQILHCKKLGESLS